MWDASFYNCRPALGSAIPKMSVCVNLHNSMASQNDKCHAQHGQQALTNTINLLTVLTRCAACLCMADSHSSVCYIFDGNGCAVAAPQFDWGPACMFPQPACLHDSPILQKIAKHAQRPSIWDHGLGCYAEPCCQGCVSSCCLPNCCCKRNKLSIHPGSDTHDQVGEIVNTYSGCARCVESVSQHAVPDSALVLLLIHCAAAIALLQLCAIATWLALQPQSGVVLQLTNCM